MKTTRTRKTQLNRPNNSVFLFHRYRLQLHGPETFGTSNEPRKIGKYMASKVAKKLKLTLDI